MFVPLSNFHLFHYFFKCFFLLHLLCDIISDFSSSFTFRFFSSFCCCWGLLLHSFFVRFKDSFKLNELHLFQFSSHIILLFCSIIYCTAMLTDFFVALLFMANLWFIRGWSFFSVVHWFMKIFIVWHLASLIP